jgi:YidC/Oxa1 family membrane protein insertase
MDNTRLILFIALSFVTLMLWDAWQRDYHTPANDVVQSNEVAPPSDAPSIDINSTGVAPAKVPTPQRPLTYEPLDAATGDVITVNNDVLELSINLLGGGISRASLTEYPVELNEPENPFALLDHIPGRLFIHQGGIKGTGEAPDHRARYLAASANFELSPGNDEVTVDLRWAAGETLDVIKRYTLRRGSYVIDVDYVITNKSKETWSGRGYEQLQSEKPESKRGLIYTFTGAALSTPEKRYEKFDYDDLEDTPLNADVEGGWVGILEHYFVSALLPPPESPSHYYSLILDDTRYAVGYWGPPVTLAPGDSGTFQSSVFIGPKLQDVLHDVAPGLELTVDFGVLWFIAKPLFVALAFIHSITGNWGIAIIMITLSLKLVFYPLSAAGYRSMAKMRKVQPRMMAMKERYGGDRTRMNQAMMELYKEEKINPLGGCLPILIQIPVFISLYWVLLESVELRQAPFGLWIHDLSSKDPFYILPLIMGVSMWIQQKLNPAPMDPVQQKVMQVLPFAFTIFFMFFPSGLVLYWVVNNVLSIAQQWHITRTIENAENA